MCNRDNDYNIIVEKNVMVPMRDGTKLATDIYRPAQGNKVVDNLFPTILGRTSYNKNWKSLWIDPVANYFTPKGYIVVLQDIRGRGESEGVGEYFHTVNINEGNDGFDTVEWIASQSWSNGKVGMTGSSHGGIVQTVASLTKPPHLTTIWVDVAPTNIFFHEAREGGCMSLWMFAALFLHAHDAPEIKSDLFAQQLIIDGWRDIKGLLNSMPFEKGSTPLKVVPNLEETLLNYYYRGKYDDFWGLEACNQEQYFYKSLDIPAVFSGGWYDPFASATVNQFVQMNKKNKTYQKLDMGPWNHSGRRTGETFAGDVDFGNDASYGVQGYGKERLLWFDRWLKNMPNGVENEPPVKIFVMGGGNGNKNKNGKLNHGGKWRFEQEWPLSRTKYEKFYLNKSGLLSKYSPKEANSSISYEYDPNNPVPTISATSALSELSIPEKKSDLSVDGLKEFIKPIFYDGGAHQKEYIGNFGSKPPYRLLSDRNDILVFETETLAKDIEITGEIKVFLWVGSSAKDTDFTLKIIDVYPANEDYIAGYHLAIADSVLRMRFRNGFEKEEMMSDSEIYKIQIKLPPISNVFKINHRIRIDISSSNFPRFDFNPNTGEPLGKHTYLLTAYNTLYLNRKHASYIELPVIP
ncbi:MAG: CocE/NonD family hydrolase [SAR202 cluster bacterium]|nr:CocE/NonD family hydrolase [SAR202 cluster bacterium]